MFILKGRVPLFFHWAVALALPICILAKEASFDLEKSLSTTCDRHCYNGVCLNGSCACTKGWSGPQCDHCYGRIRLSENQTQLSDGPLNYSSSSKCTWIIESDKPTNGPLNIRLENFRTECGWDFVYIYDGDGVHGDLLAAFCGDQDPQELSAPSGKALIYFFSDLAMNLDGFNITYEFEKCPYNCSNHGICEKQACKCDAGYTGEYCNVQVCTNDLEGVDGPCKNNGKCSKGRCSCPPNFHGEYCQEVSHAVVWDEVITPKDPTARASHASVLIDDVIWTIGGEHFTGALLDDVVTFNITSRTWTTIIIEGAERPEARYDHTVVRYKNKLFMFGGVKDRNDITRELWSFDLQTRRWHLESEESVEDNLTTPPLASSGHSAHVIGSEMFVFFGYHPRIGFIYQVQIYNFETKKWRFGNSRDHVQGRFRHASVQYETDQGNVVLVYGGSMWSNLQSNNLTDSLMQYSVKQERWIHLPASGTQQSHHTATVLNGLVIVTGGTIYNMSTLRPKQDCFCNAVFIYDIACKQWYNVSKAPSAMKRYGHTAIATDNELYVFGGFDGKMLNDVFRFSPAKCNSATRPEECRSIFDAVKCIYFNGSCEKLDPFVSYKQPFLSFVKNESPKGAIQCKNTPLRQALQSCEDQKDCTSCTSQSECGWCASGDQCLQRDADCVDGQMILTTYQKCPASIDVPPPRPCSMSNDCHSCKLLSHCNWFTVDNKNVCISLEEQEILLAEQHSRELERLTNTNIALRHSPLPTASYMQNSTQCIQACADISECGDCISNTRCMWCPSTVRCINMEAYTVAFAYGQCHSWVTGNSPEGHLKTCAQESSNCSSHKTCAECHLSPQCGWLDDGSKTGLGECVRGNSTGALDGNSNSVNSTWYYLDCPPCQCNGHSKCSNTTTTFLANREVCTLCENNTTGRHCETCAAGYFGDPRNGGTCSPCECHGQADDCDPRTGYCHCHTKGVIGKYCDKCDHKYYGTPVNGTPCYYELAVDFIFTFKLKKEDKDRHVTDIYLFSIPYKKDTDVTFQISCEPAAYVALSETTSFLPGHPPRNRTLMTRTHCDHRGFRRIYSASDSDGWSFGNDHNTTFFVRVYNFSTPITIQVSFAQSPPINWVLFFVIFAACFIVLLVVAGLLWMIKLRIEVYRRNQRRIDEIEHIRMSAEEMASRPFANVKLELSTPYTATSHSPTPLSIEPCGNYKAGVFTLAVRLPTGGRATTPNGTSGLAVASALCLLTPAQLGVLQAPETNENKNQRKTNMRRYIPFLRGRQVENA